VIIFTRYKSAQRIIVEHCEAQGWDVVAYHGELTTAEQQAARARFLKNPDCRIFVSTHAGERGTDLPVANWLINYDPVWSAGQADQINGRHMRTSSTFEDIFVANLFLEGSIEERKLELQDDKRKVARAIIDGDMPSTGRVYNMAESLKSHVEMWLQRNDPDGIVLLNAE
jgi:SNF2 family DNA or RNA helicase